MRISAAGKSIRLWASAWWAFFQQPPTPNDLVNDAIEVAKQEQRARLIAEGELQLVREHHRRVMRHLTESNDPTVRAAALIAQIRADRAGGHGRN